MYVYYVLDQNSISKPSENSLERQESSESEICSQQPFTTLQAYDNSEVLQCSAKRPYQKNFSHQNIIDWQIGYWMMQVVKQVIHMSYT